MERLTRETVRDYAENLGRGLDQRVVDISRALLKAWDALEVVEWVVPLGQYSACPACGEVIENGHREDCKLSQALPNTKEGK
jgi:hypothetical protein